jgi:hypothetical protein
MSEVNPGTQPMEPTAAEVEQAEITIPAVAVKVEGLVRTQELPAVHAYFGSVAVGNTQPIKLINADPKRKRLLLSNVGARVWIGRSSGDALSKACFQMIAPDMIDMENQEELWVMADTGNTVVSYCAEVWTG